MKWRFRPSKKRQLCAFSTTFLPIFSGFFRELADQGAIWRECDPEKRDSWSKPNRERMRYDPETVHHSLPIQGAGQPGPRAENRERGQSQARWIPAIACE